MNHPIRVAAVILEYHPIVGGAQRQLAQLAPFIRSEGIDLRVFTRRYHNLPSSEVINGVPVTRLPAPGPKPMAGPLFIGSTLRALHHFKPHLIHAFSLFSPLTTAVWAKRFWHIPVVVKILRGGRLGDIQRIQKKVNGGRRLASYRRHVDRFIAISSEIQGELTHIGVSAQQQLTLPNGVDVQRITPPGHEEKVALRHRLNLPKGQLVIYTGRFVPAKQLPQLLKAWQEVQRHCSEAHLLLLGDGPEEQKLRDMNPQRVIFGGRKKDVTPYLQAADIFILPSANEGLSNAMLEAMAAGLPVIATAVGGAPDIIKHGYNGWLIDPQSPEEITLALLTLIRKPDLMAQLGKRARRRMTEAYALENIAAQHVSLYRSLVLQPQSTVENGSNSYVER
ncbi:MAG: glycosyltransferase family 4 protein [Ardenticatenaceae bacterium]|nr:glycosyltransferase family 4 protein [Ardenticatenaceae bacterium]